MIKFLVFVVVGLCVAYNPFPIEHEMSVVIYGYSTIAVILNLLFTFQHECPHELYWDDCIPCQFENNVININAVVLEETKSRPG